MEKSQGQRTRDRKATKELEKKASKTYNIMALCNVTMTWA